MSTGTGHGFDLGLLDLRHVHRDQIRTQHPQTIQAGERIEVVRLEGTHLVAKPVKED